MSMQREKSRPYRAYLLRCWQEGEAAPGKEPLWRFSVEEILSFAPSAGSGQSKLKALPERRRKGFSGLEALIAFLRARLDSSEDEPSDGESQ
jgi:hypothetical protein